MARTEVGKPTTPANELRPCKTPGFCHELEKLIDQIVENKIDAIIAEAAAEDAAMWALCFGDTSPKNVQEKQARINRVASGRAIVSFLNHKKSLPRAKSG